MTERDFLDNKYQPTLADFKKHLRITTTAQDAMLTMYLKAAISHAEHYIGEVIALSRYKQVEDLSFDSALDLQGPVQEVESVSVDGQVLSPGDYMVSGRKLVLSSETSGKVEVIYIAGRKSVDYDVKAAILLMAADIFMNPADGVRTMPTASSRLLDPHRTFGDE